MIGGFCAKGKCTSRNEAPSTGSQLYLLFLVWQRLCSTSNR